MTKVMVIADVHANFVALQNAYKKAQEVRPDCILFLGDYITDCPYPQKTMALLYTFKEHFDCRFIRGNREDYMIEHQTKNTDEWTYCSRTGALLYTYQNLLETDLDFFKQMPIFDTLYMDACPPLSFCHASPTTTRDMTFENKALLKKHLENLEHDILLLGHSHLYKTMTYKGKQAIFCPSLGLPEMHENHPCCLLLTCNNNMWTHELLEIPTDFTPLYHAFYTSDLIKKAPIWSKSIIEGLKRKESLCFTCICLANELKAHSNLKNTKDFEEEFFVQAAQMLHII